jgi:hypothetical protein
MKFKTFRALVLGGLGLAVVSGVIGLALCSKPAAVSAPDPATEPDPATAPAKAVEPKGGSGAGLALRSFDEEILKRIATTATGDKVKDLFPGRPYKVNLYREGSSSTFDRVKIDLDRDDKWDEKWSIEREGGVEVVKRKVAPNDDENYSVEYRLRDGAWVEKKK